MRKAELLGHSVMLNPAVYYTILYMYHFLLLYTTVYCAVMCCTFLHCRSGWATRHCAAFTKLSLYYTLLYKDYILLCCTIVCTCIILHYTIVLFCTAGVPGPLRHAAACTKLSTIIRWTCKTCIFILWYIHTLYWCTILIICLVLFCTAWVAGPLRHAAACRQKRDDLGTGHWKRLKIKKKLQSFSKINWRTIKI